MIKDIKGIVFGKLTALNFSHSKDNVHYWLFSCSCGNEIVIKKTRVMCGNSKSCGCIRKPNPDNYTPKNSRLTFIKQITSSKSVKGERPVALYKCSCGKEKQITVDFAKSGQVKSCGCLINEANFKTHGLTLHPLYKAYIAIKDRCYRVKHSDFYNYGGRGVVMCDEWLNDFTKFYDWSMANGWKKGLQIDKDIIAKQLGVEPLIYSPDRCMWVTPKINCRTKRGNNYIEYKGVTKTVMEWSEILEMSYPTLSCRLRFKWAIEDAFFVPIDESKRSSFKKNKILC